MNRSVKIVEVGPRDGFQNIKEFIPTELKIEIIDRLVSSGLKTIQATSFVNPKAIPQMADAKEVIQTCKSKHPEVEFFALVPNYKGAEVASRVGLSKISYVISVSEKHNMSNVNKTVEESLAELKRIVEDFKGLSVRVDLGTVFGYTDGEPITTENVMHLISRIALLGIKEINLCDTVGVAVPNQVVDVVTKACSRFPELEFSLHIHDTRNMGMLNTYLGVAQCGIRSIESAVGGLGGCPFASGASGNTASEDVVYMLEQSGFSTGVNYEKLLDTAKFVHNSIQGNFSGHHINI